MMTLSEFRQQELEYVATSRWKYFMIRLKPFEQDVGVTDKRNCFNLWIIAYPSPAWHAQTRLCISYLQTGYATAT